MTVTRITSTLQPRDSDKRSVLSQHNTSLHNPLTNTTSRQPPVLSSVNIPPSNGPTAVGTLQGGTRAKGNGKTGLRLPPTPTVAWDDADEDHGPRGVSFPWQDERLAPPWCIPRQRLFDGFLSPSVAPGFVGSVVVLPGLEAVVVGRPVKPAGTWTEPAHPAVPVWLVLELFSIDARKGLGMGSVLWIITGTPSWWCMLS